MVGVELVIDECGDDGNGTGTGNGVVAGDCAPPRGDGDGGPFRPDDTNDALFDTCYCHFTVQVSCLRIL
jgi:hypothetical protein